MEMKKFRKGSYGKKRRGGVRRPVRRINRVSRGLVSRNRNPIHYFTRYAFYPAPQVSMLMDANGQRFGVIHSRGITDLYTDISTIAMPGLTDFTSLYDQYKVLSYTLEIRPRVSQFDSLDFAAGNGYPALPTIYYVYDQDDTTVPTSAASIMEHPKVRAKRLDKVAYITVKYPTVRTAVYQPGVSFAYSTNKCPWLDLTNAAVPLLGIKYVIQGHPTYNYLNFFDLRVKWRLAFKNPR